MNGLPAQDKKIFGLQKIFFTKCHLLQISALHPVYSTTLNENTFFFLKLIKNRDEFEKFVWKTEKKQI